MTGVLSDAVDQFGAIQQLLVLGAEYVLQLCVLSQQLQLYLLLELLDILMVVVLEQLLGEDERMLLPRFQLI